LRQPQILRTGDWTLIATYVDTYGLSGLSPFGSNVSMTMV